VIIPRKSYFLTAHTNPELDFGIHHITKRILGIHKFRTMYHGIRTWPYTVNEKILICTLVFNQWTWQIWEKY